MTGVLSFLGSYAVLEGGAFAGAMAAILIVYYMAKSGKEVAPIKLVLVGTAVSAMFTAFSNFIVYKAPDDAKIREVTFWTLGSVASAKWEELIPLAVVLVPGCICMYAMSTAMNALLMGESSAVTLGVNVNLVRKITVFLSAALTGIAVAGRRKHRICGTGNSSYCAFHGGSRPQKSHSHFHTPGSHFPDLGGRRSPYV